MMMNKAMTNDMITCEELQIIFNALKQQRKRAIKSKKIPPTPTPCMVLW